jgi:hypothetical protein
MAAPIGTLDSIISVQPMWSEADKFYYAVSVLGKQQRGFLILVYGTGKSIEEFQEVGRSAVERWCRINLHQLPIAGETRRIQWKLLQAITSDRPTGIGASGSA